LACHNYDSCTDVARTNQKFSIQFYEIVGKQALRIIELEPAKIAFQMCKNGGMIYSIQSIKGETDKQILVGHIASILFKHDIAQEVFAKSSNPILALDMRMDL
jgi:WD repeat-containing protein 19